MTYRKIATEEAFATPEIMEAWTQALAAPDAEAGFAKMGETILANSPANAMLKKRLVDIGDGRIARMDEVGLDMHVLSITSPGVQMLETSRAVGLAAEANDRLVEAVKAHPDRFAGLCAVAPQDPDAAAREIERMRKAGLCGLLINSHTKGEYLDLPKFTPIFEAAESEAMPLYLHPREPGPTMVTPYLDYGLYFAGWGFAAETGLHAMRLIMSGLFDRFPKLTVILGHLGEGIPFYLDRIDNRYLLSVKIGAVDELPKLPSQYFRDNFILTTAGMTSAAPLNLCIDMLGADRIMFAADYPYEDDAEGVRFLDTVDIGEDVRRQIYETTAARIFGL